MRLSKNGSFRFLNEKMAELIINIKLMETCEVTKHITVGHKSQKTFLCIGTKNMISMINPGDALLPKSIHLLESLAGDFKKIIFKMTSDTLEKVQNKSNVTTILNAENISDASKIIRLRSECNIEKDDTTIISSRNSTSRNEDSTFSSILVTIRLQSQVIPLLIGNSGITLVQWKIDVDTTKV